MPPGQNVLCQNTSWTNAPRQKYPKPKCPKLMTIMTYLHLCFHDTFVIESQKGFIVLVFTFKDGFGSFILL